MTQDWKEDLRKATGQPKSAPKAGQTGGGEPPLRQGGGPQGIGQGTGQRYEDFWQQYFQVLQDGYFEKSGYLRPELIVNDAQEIAQRLENGGMTRSLLRNFYGEVATIRHLVRQRPSDFDRFKPRILKLRAHASNATNRRTAKAPVEFFNFIDRNVGLASRDKESFLDGFCEHFECVVLYFKGR